MGRFRSKRHQMEDQENHERWLLTYADLITLLLAFFVVMYSMSQIDAKRFGQMAEALQGILKGGESILENDAAILNEEGDGDGHGLLNTGNLKMLQQTIEDKSDERRELKDVQTELTERALRRIQAGQDPEEVLRQLASTLTNKILHLPSKRLREAAEEQDYSVLRAADRIFRADGEEE